ncbi:hypothetical protein ACOTJF_07675, partial [Achromobacter ruhlandii]|uniref:hypothetical protein n=1 Tax=Achromobacter ruhlandii TaxID=72557 RepID=UPI003B9E07CF
ALLTGTIATNDINGHAGANIRHLKAVSEPLQASNSAPWPWPNPYEPGNGAIGARRSAGD